MLMIHRFFALATALIVSLLSGGLAWGQISPYVYVKMSLGVPWFLYFFFLLTILIPFFLMIIFAWRRYLKSGDTDQDENIR